MIEKENNKYSIIAINDAKNERLEKNQIYYLLLLKIKIRKLETMKKQSKNLKMMKNYEFKNILIERRFLFKVVQ